MVRRGLAGLVLFAASLAGASAVGPATPASADDAEVTMLETDREPSGAPFAYVGTALPGGFRFYDNDLPQVLTRAVVRVTSTSDPVGVPVWSTREAFNAGVYSGEFGFSTVASDPLRGVIRVKDGDQVSVSHVDANGHAGTPTVITGSAPWRAGSAQPDWRELSFADTDPLAPVVRGSWRAAPPGATVKVYAAKSAPAAMASGVAGPEGSFAVTLPPFGAARPGELWVAAVEPGQSESERVSVLWAAATGRIVRPDDGGPVRSVFATFYKAGCQPQTDDACWGGGGFTDHHGRYSATPAISGGRPTPGDYSLVVRHQEPSNPAAPAPWRTSAYGDPAPRAFTVSDPTTEDLGDTALLPPNFLGKVKAGVFPVNDAYLYLDYPNGAAAPGGGHTRPDGRFALHLKDGDYHLKVLPPPGCGGFAYGKQVAISVRKGVATPATAEIDVALGGQSVPPSVIPVAGGNGAPIGVDVHSPAGQVSVTLIGGHGDGQISLGCGPVGDLPTVDIVAPPVEIDVPGLSFQASDVCLAYDPEALAAQGVDLADVELVHIADNGAVEPITDVVDTAEQRLCGRTLSFSSFALGVLRDGPPAPPGPNLPVTDGSGYWMLGEGGDVYAFGDSEWLGNAGEDAVDIEPTPSGRGYWILTSRGAVIPRGDARWFGVVGTLHAGERVTSLSSMPRGDGYWVFTTFGRSFAFGKARHLGDMAGVALNGPVLDSVATPSGAGYYMVASDGGIFAFGDANFRGSMGSTPLNAPVQSLVPDGDGLGYWLVASDGGVFAFDSPFRGAMGHVRLNAPVTGMVRFGNGYLMVGADGGIFNFSDSSFHGSLGSNPPARPVVAVAALS